MAEVRRQLEVAEHEAIIEIATNHFTNFGYDNMPTFCIGLVDEAQGTQPSTYSAP